MIDFIYKQIPYISGSGFGAPIIIKTEPGSPKPSSQPLSTTVTRAEDESMEASEETEEEPDPLYLAQTYLDTSKSKTENSELSIASYEQEIIKTVEDNRIIIICGPTGCGKTTQVPQYIANHCMKYHKKLNIVVTQPRRIAATSVAKRVCQERGWQLGSMCGYQIGMDRKHVTRDTRLLYCTTGILLRKVISDPHLGRWSHIIVDEVHERNEDTDLLLMVLKQLIYKERCDTKIILMSATFDVEKFKNYFPIDLPLLHSGMMVSPQVSMTE